MTEIPFQNIGPAIHCHTRGCTAVYLGEPGNHDLAEVLASAAHQGWAVRYCPATCPGCFKETAE